MVFYHKRGGGDTPNQTISVFFQGEKISLLKNDPHTLKHEKKIGNYFSPIMTPHPPSPLEEHQN